MLKTIDPRITPELMDCLIRLGHGDEIVIADRNFPAASTAAHCVLPDVIRLPGFDAPDAVALITTLMPIDNFTDYGALRMEVDGEPDRVDSVHADTFAVLEKAAPSGAHLRSLERQAFYAHAKTAFAVVACSEDRPFGCFILRMGVVFPD
ncbi:RbsD/FucU family protein [Meridianimarinicoccus sp. RP-17]|uniref:RbsD/FucU family protein n=1 Tax=Meridianimarinicoccus zhengii TaxID=2056810 RepID=UPI000DABDE35|nr:RbsD/FucU domain-containing protein [Phycocomes zhengii]